MNKGGAKLNWDNGRFSLRGNDAEREFPFIELEVDSGGRGLEGVGTEVESFGISILGGM